MSHYGGRCTWCGSVIGDYWASNNPSRPHAWCDCGWCNRLPPKCAALWYGPERGWEPVKEKQ